MTDSCQVSFAIVSTNKAKGGMTMQSYCQSCGMPLVEEHYWVLKKKGTKVWIIVDTVTREASLSNPS